MKVPKKSEVMKLVASAIRLLDGRVFMGKRHHDAFAAAKAAGVPRMVEVQSEQGFVTEDGTFLSRAAALELALKTGQFKLPLIGGDELTSEDLW